MVLVQDNKPEEENETSTKEWYSNSNSKFWRSQVFTINIPEIIKASNEAGLPVDVYEHKTVAAKGW